MRERQHQPLHIPAEAVIFYTISLTAKALWKDDAMDGRQGFVVYEICLVARIRSNSSTYIVVTLCDCFEPTRCPRFDEHARYQGAVAT